MPNNSSNITLPEAQDIVMQLPAIDRWALVKTLIESLQPENLQQQSIAEHAEEIIDYSEPSTYEMMALADSGGSFDFWNTEPDLYDLVDGEPV
jgi:hypothetical protein